MDTSSEIAIKLPVKIKYEALQQMINKKLVDQYVEKENEAGEATRYAQIIDAEIVHSTEHPYDLDMYVGVKMLTSIFKNKIMSMVVHLSTSFNSEEQKLEVSHFKIKTKTHSWLGDKFLQVTFNSLLHEFIKKKMRLDLHQIIQQRIQKLNARLSNSIEPQKGVFLKGKIENIRILEIEYLPEYLMIFNEIHAQGEVLLKEFPL